MKSRNWQEIRIMSVLELEAKLRETEEKLFRLKFSHSTTPVRNGLEIRSQRRMIAKIKTLLNEKSMQEKAAGAAK